VLKFKKNSGAKGFAPHSCDVGGLTEMLLENLVFWFVRLWYVPTFRSDGLLNVGNYLNSTRRNVPEDRKHQVKSISDLHIARLKIQFNNILPSTRRSPIWSRLFSFPTIFYAHLWVPLVGTCLPYLSDVKILGEDYNSWGGFFLPVFVFRQFAIERPHGATDQVSHPCTH
jgi:hypothetical protein